MTGAKAKRLPSFGPSFWMWAVVVGPVLVWLLHLGANFLFAAYMCGEKTWIPRFFTVGSLLVILFLVLRGAKAWKYFRTKAGEDGKSFMALVGTLIGALLALAVAAEDLFSLFLESCV